MLHLQPGHNPICLEIRMNQSLQVAKRAHQMNNCLPTIGSNKCEIGAWCPPQLMILSSKFYLYSVLNNSLLIFSDCVWAYLQIYLYFFSSARATCTRKQNIRQGLICRSLVGREAKRAKRQVGQKGREGTRQRGKERKYWLRAAINYFAAIFDCFCQGKFSACLLCLIWQSQVKIYLMPALFCAYGSTEMMYRKINPSQQKGLKD